MKLWAKIILCIISMIVFVFVFITLSYDNCWAAKKSPADLDSSKPFIFGIGLPRTGTCSLTKALTQLGWTTHHYPKDFRKHWKQYMQNRNALIDLVTIGLRPLELVQQFPNALFVYTHRDLEGWIKSMRRVRKIIKFFCLIPAAKRTLQQFDSVFGEPSKWPDFYDQYEAEVKELERQKPQQVLRLRIVSGEGWDKLCPFLGVSSPGGKFPRKRELLMQVEQCFYQNIHYSTK